MAPIRIRHIVSFSSQDPRHPADNLLREEHLQPWLICPRDRGRQLRVELQLERASRIAYIDIGNSGSAFLQIDVGRSSWPLDQSYVTLLPTATLMSPADSKLGKGGTGVRMFKEGDFLQEAAGEKWDRLRITCSQPFNKQAQFGLCFIRVRSPADEEDRGAAPAPDTNQQEDKLPSLSGRSADQSNKEEELDSRGRAQKMFEEKLQRVLASHSPRSPKLSRTAQMVLTAAKSRKRTLPLPVPPSPPCHPQREERERPLEDSPASSGSCPDTSVTSPRPRGRGRQRAGARGRGRQTAAANPARTERDHAYKAQLHPEADPAYSSCPICGDYFPLDQLPGHASSCGETHAPFSILLSSSDDDSSDGSPELWVTCPLCAFRFPGSEVERHASTCGE